MKHRRTITIEANSEELLVAVLDAFDNSERIMDAIHGWLEDHPADPLSTVDHESDEGGWNWKIEPEPEPEVLLQLGFRFYGAPMAEILEVSSQRRFEKWALEWQEGTLEEYLVSEDDIRAVYEERPADPEVGMEEPEFVCFQIGNVKIDIC